MIIHGCSPKYQFYDYFQVTVRRNLEYQDMMRTINNFSKMEDHNYGEMCVVIILSHGNDGGLINAADGKVVSTEYVLRRFNNDACPALKGKPKFFVLQACRGDEVNTRYMYSRYLSRFFDCLANPNLSATLATDQKWP